MRCSRWFLAVGLTLIATSMVQAQYGRCPFNARAQVQLQIQMQRQVQYQQQMMMRQQSAMQRQQQMRLQQQQTMMARQRNITARQNTVRIQPRNSYTTRRTSVVRVTPRININRSVTRSTAYRLTRTNWGTRTGPGRGYPVRRSSSNTHLVRISRTTTRTNVQRSLHLQRLTQQRRSVTRRNAITQRPRTITRRVTQQRPRITQQRRPTQQVRRQNTVKQTPRTTPKVTHRPKVQLRVTMSGKCGGCHNCQQGRPTIRPNMPQAFPTRPMPRPNPVVRNNPRPMPLPVVRPQPRPGPLPVVRLNPRPMPVVRFDPRLPLITRPTVRRLPGLDKPSLTPITSTRPTRKTPVKAVSSMPDWVAQLPREDTMEGTTRPAPVATEAPPLPALEGSVVRLLPQAPVQRKTSRTREEPAPSPDEFTRAPTLSPLPESRGTALTLLPPGAATEDDAEPPSLEPPVNPRTLVLQPPPLAPLPDTE